MAGERERKKSVCKKVIQKMKKRIHFSYILQQ